MARYYTLLVIVGMLLCSCGGKIKCDDPRFVVTFKGFDTSALSDILIYRYSNTGTYVTILDSVVSGTEHGQYWNKEKEGFTFSNLNAGVVKPENDWIVYMPKENRRYKIRDISMEPKTEHTTCILCENECFNDATFYLNDSLFAHQTGWHYDDSLINRIVYIMLIK